MFLPWNWIVGSL